MIALPHLYFLYLILFRKSNCQTSLSKENLGTQPCLKPQSRNSFFRMNSGFHSDWTVVKSERQVTVIMAGFCLSTTRRLLAHVNRVLRTPVALKAGEPAFSASFFPEFRAFRLAAGKPATSLPAVCFRSASLCGVFVFPEGKAIAPPDAVRWKKTVLKANLLDRFFRFGNRHILSPVPKNNH